MSGKGDELRDYEGISAAAIVSTVKRLIGSEAGQAALTAEGRGAGGVS
jgi:hypothetical protein